MIGPGGAVRTCLDFINRISVGDAETGDPHHASSLWPCHSDLRASLVGLSTGDTEASITGKTQSGEDFTGTDSVNIVGGGNAPPGVRARHKLTTNEESAADTRFHRFTDVDDTSVPDCQITFVAPI